MEHPTHIDEADIWIDRIRRNAKEILKNTLVGGLAIFIAICCMASEVPPDAPASSPIIALV